MMSDSEGSLGLAGLLFAAGPAAGFATYAWIVGKYRNKNAKYRPDREVKFEVVKLDVEDEFIERVVTDNSSTPGRNESSHDKRAGYARVTKD